MAEDRGDIEAGAPALIETLRATSLLYLSPHYDDIAFSLGITARTIGRGTMLDLFTRSLHIPVPPAPRSAPWTVEEASAIRDVEDARFAESAGLTRQILGLDEPQLRGRRRHRDLSGLAEDRAQLAEPLRRAVTAFEAANPGPLALFAPASIGDHVNHIATLMEVVALMPTLAPRWRFFFYEDLPYASRWWQRQTGLHRLRRLLPGRRGHRHTLTLGPRIDDKLAIVRLYPSQHGRPATMRRFSPRTGLANAPHEAFWEFSYTA